MSARTYLCVGVRRTTDQDWAKLSVDWAKLSVDWAKLSVDWSELNVRFADTSRRANTTLATHRGDLTTTQPVIARLQRLG